MWNSPKGWWARLGDTAARNSAWNRRQGWLTLDTPLCVCKSVVSAPAHQTLQPPDTLALGSPRAPEPPPARTWVLLQPPQLCSPRCAAGDPKSGSRAGAHSGRSGGLPGCKRKGGSWESKHVMFSAYLRVGGPCLHFSKSHQAWTSPSVQEKRWWAGGRKGCQVSSSCQDDSPQWLWAKEGCLQTWRIYVPYLSKCSHVQWNIGHWISRKSKEEGEEFRKQ